MTTLADTTEETPDLADLNLVLAMIKADDALKSRAEKYLARPAAKPIVTFATGIELLLWCRKTKTDYVEAVDSCIDAFDVEQEQELLMAAHALRNEGVTSPFDAVHLAAALHRRVKLVTADEALWKTRYPTQRF